MLATGSAPKTLPGLEIDGERVITSDHALKLDRVPASVVVLGGGVIGVEFASVWRSFGAEVTIVEALPQLLPLEDESSSKLLERAFRRRGIDVRARRPVRAASSTPTPASASRWRAARRSTPSCCWSRSAAAPVSAGLGYEEAGVAIERGFVKVDELLPDQRPDDLRGRRPDRRPCSSRTSASPRASWSPSRSPG